MKKLVLLMVLVMLVFGIAACTEKTDGDPVQQTENSSGTVSGNESDYEVPKDTCEHAYTQEVINEPTCTEKGVAQYMCLNCKASHTEEIPAYGHDGSGASCEEASTCANCGEVVEAAWGHEDEGGVCATCGIDLTKGSAPAATEGTEAAEESEATEASQAAE